MHRLTPQRKAHSLKPMFIDQSTGPGPGPMFSDATPCAAMWLLFSVNCNLPALYSSFLRDAQGHLNGWPVDLDIETSCY